MFQADVETHLSHLPPQSNNVALVYRLHTQAEMKSKQSNYIISIMLSIDKQAGKKYTYTYHEVPILEKKYIY